MGENKRDRETDNVCDREKDTHTENEKGRGQRKMEGKEGERMQGWSHIIALQEIITLKFMAHLLEVDVNDFCFLELWDNCLSLLPVPPTHFIYQQYYKK